MANVDDVHNLLRAVNETTLKRMEEQQLTTQRMLDIVNREIHGIQDKLGITPGSLGPEPPPSP